MAEQQRMLDGTLAPVGPHRDDDILCSDGTLVKRPLVLLDCKGGAHSNEEDQHDANVSILTEYLSEGDEWVKEHTTTEGSDYPSAYACILSEGHHNWEPLIVEWLFNSDDNPGDPLLTLLSAEIADNVDPDDAEPKYNSSDYSSYSGKGCCIDSFAIDEYEHEHDVMCTEVLRTLHEQGQLDACIDDVNCDVFIARDSYSASATHPTLTTYHTPGGGWDFVIPAGRMDELLAQAIIAVCRRIDG